MSNSSDRERQYQLDALTLAWALAYRRWLANDNDSQPFPALEPFVAGLSPDEAAAFRRYALETAICGMGEPFVEPETVRQATDTVEKTLARIRARQQEGGA